ncbi:MAG: DUF4349 domain-containing protein [Chloroflexota bacterium]
MSKFKRWIGFILIVLILGACAMGASEEQAVGGAAPSEAEAPMAEPASGEVEVATEGETTGGVSQPQVQEQLIIRTGNLEIVVEDTEAAIDEIARRTNATGGWVVSSDVFQRGTDKSGSMTIRVPVEQFDAMMNEIEALATEVLGSSTSGEDVTEEYVDRRARLENLEATADRVRSFLDEAENVEEALAVNAELSRLEGEIEAMRGRIQFLEQSAAYSTINVNITPDALAQPIEVGSWRPTGVVRDAFSALITALQGLATVLIWVLVTLLPLALIVLLPIAAIFFFIRRRRRSTSATAAADSSSEA